MEFIAIAAVYLKNSSSKYRKRNDSSEAVEIQHFKI